MDDAGSHERAIDGSGSLPVGPPPPGWYAHPSQPGLQLWWDGVAWGTASRALPPPPAPLACLVCGNGTFADMQYMLNTQGLTLLGWDGFNRTATCRVCENCGFIHWFAQR